MDELAGGDEDEPGGLLKVFPRLGQRLLLRIGAWQFLNIHDSPPIGILEGGGELGHRTLLLLAPARHC